MYQNKQPIPAFGVGKLLIFILLLSLVKRKEVDQYFSKSVSFFVPSVTVFTLQLVSFLRTKWTEWQVTINFWVRGNLWTIQPILIKLAGVHSIACQVHWISWETTNNLAMTLMNLTWLKLEKSTFHWLLPTNFHCSNSLTTKFPESLFNVVLVFATIVYSCM